MQSRRFDAHWRFFFDELERLDKVNNDQLDGYEKDSEQAGIKELEKFKELNVIDALAGGDILKYDDVLSMDVYTVMAVQYLRQEQGKFQKRLRKVMERNAKRKAKRR